MNAPLRAWRARLLLAGALAAGARDAAGAGPGADVVRVNGEPYVAASDLARLLDGVQYWRADTRKLVIRLRGHRLTLTEGVPLALLDDRTLRLDAPVRSLGGELQVPVSLLPQLPADSGGVRLVVDTARNRVRVATTEGVVGAPRVDVEGDVTRVRIGTARPRSARVVHRALEHFRIWLPGVAGASVADPPPEESRVRAFRRLASGNGVIWELALRRGTGAWRLLSDVGEDGVVLEFAEAEPGWERVERPEAVAPRPLRVVVLDPGHGGEDTGVGVPGAQEKDLALRLARLLASELERRAGSRVLLTRDSDRAVPQPERAEIANRARADLVLSLHFDGVALTRARGATAWCPRLGDTGGGAASGEPALVPWRDVAQGWSGASRALADDVTTALEARGQGPARVRERLPVPLLGVNAPGILLECATLTSGDDLARVSRPEGLRALAAAIADGVLTWAGHD